MSTNSDATPNDRETNSDQLNAGNHDRLDLAEQVEELVAVFKNMDKSSIELTKRVDEYQTITVKTMSNYKTMLSVVAGGVVLIFCLLGLGAYLVKTQDDNTQRINELQERTSSEVLCPLYGLLINSINANPEPSNLTPDQIKFRQDAAQTFKKGYQELRCGTL